MARPSRRVYQSSCAARYALLSQGKERQDPSAGWGGGGEKDVPRPTASLVLRPRRTVPRLRWSMRSAAMKVDSRAEA